MMSKSKKSAANFKNSEMNFTNMIPTEAIGIIMDKYGDEVKRLVYTYVKSYADTEDVTQEIFVTVYRKLSSFQGNSSFRTWLYAIAINKCKDHLKSWQYRNKKLKEKLLRANKINLTGTDSPEVQLLKQNETNQLFNQIMALSVKYREVIILFYFRDLSTKEISNILNVKEATVRTRLSRGRESLKKLLLEERGGTFG